MIQRDLRYTQQHEWVRADGGVATVGITDHAQEALGDVTFVELPEPGLELKAGDEACAIESAKAAAAIYAPVAGTVSAANTDVEDDPSLVNSDCYGAGWVYKLEMSDPAELDALMDAAAYEQFLAGEEH